MLNLFPSLYKSSKKPQNKAVFSANPALTQTERQLVSDALISKGEKLANSIYKCDYKRGFSIIDEANRFCRCGTHYQSWSCERDGQKFHVPVSCHSRICERCGDIYRAKIIDSIKTNLKPYFDKRRRGWGVFFLTLTTKVGRYQSDSPGRPDIKRLYDESSKLLRLFFGRYKCRMTKNGAVIEDTTRYKTVRNFEGKLIKRKKTPKYRINSKGKQVADYRTWRGSGFISAIEMGQNNSMLHIHAIVYAPYISQKKISEKWLEITGDSYIVDIRKVQQLNKAAWEVLKYIIKPPITDSYMTLADYAVAIKGSRRLRTGGIFYNVIRKIKQLKLDFACPYCKGRLINRGIMNCEPDLETSGQLYKLLKEVDKRGSPLKYPDSWVSPDELFMIKRLAGWRADPASAPVNMRDMLDL